MVRAVFLTAEAGPTGHPKATAIVLKIVKEKEVVIATGADRAGRG